MESLTETTWSNRSWMSLLAFIAICVAVEVVGGLLTSLSVKSWYQTISKPSWNPPSWIFGPVWTALYLSMAFAGWLVWKERVTRNIQVAMMLFGIQLFLNLLWSGFFFGLRNPMLAFFDIALLWMAILATAIAFWYIRPIAGILLTPYLAWVGFAAVLNFSIWRMNA